jgi:hypothetical protein
MSENLRPATDTSSAPPASDDAPDVFRHIDNPITGSGDEQIVRAAMAEGRKREREWEQGVGGDDPFAEQRAPVVERKYDGRDTAGPCAKLRRR